jgi:hypothetical protein
MSLSSIVIIVLSLAVSFVLLWGTWEAWTDDWRVACVVWLLSGGLLLDSWMMASPSKSIESAQTALGTPVPCSTEQLGESLRNLATNDSLPTPSQKKAARVFVVLDGSCWAFEAAGTGTSQAVRE